MLTFKVFPLWFAYSNIIMQRVVIHGTPPEYMCPPVWQQEHTETKTGLRPHHSSRKNVESLLSKLDFLMLFGYIDELWGEGGL